MKEIITFIILINNVFQVKNDSVLVNMVNFSGYAESEYFKGYILPGAVDTQTILADGSTHLSARYMLKGIDQNGDSCHVYINNEVTSDTPKGYTRPTIVTDSKSLSSLVTGKLVGKMDTVEDRFVIRIFISEQ